MSDSLYGGGAYSSAMQAEALQQQRQSMMAQKLQANMPMLTPGPAGLPTSSVPDFGSMGTPSGLMSSVPQLMKAYQEAQQRQQQQPPAMAAAQPT